MNDNATKKTVKNNLLFDFHDDTPIIKNGIKIEEESIPIITKQVNNALKSNRKSKYNNLSDSITLNRTISNDYKNDNSDIVNNNNSIPKNNKLGSIKDKRSKNHSD